MGKTNFNMQLTDEEKEIMDFAVDVIFSEYALSKADLVSMLVKQTAIDYLHMDIEWHQISDEQLLVLLKHEKRSSDFAFLQMVGVDKFKIMLEDFKKKYPDKDNSYNEELLAEYIEQQKSKELE